MQTSVATEPTPPAPEPEPVAAPVAAGDCSLVNNYDWDKRVAYGVCMAESTGNPKAIGDTSTAYPSCGLMQIRTLPGRPSCDQLHDPVFNIQYAYDMWKGQGWTPWSGYTTGAYLNYL